MFQTRTYWVRGFRAYWNQVSIIWFIIIIIIFIILFCLYCRKSYYFAAIKVSFSVHFQHICSVTTALFTCKGDRSICLVKVIMTLFLFAVFCAWPMALSLCWVQLSHTKQTAKLNFPCNCTPFCICFSRLHFYCS